MPPSNNEKSPKLWTERDSLLQARNRTKETLINKAYEYFKKCEADVYLYIHYENKYFTAEFSRDGSPNAAFQLLTEELDKVYPPPIRITSENLPMSKKRVKDRKSKDRKRVRKNSTLPNKRMQREAGRDLTKETDLEYRRRGDEAKTNLRE